MGIPSSYEYLCWGFLFKVATCQIWFIQLSYQLDVLLNPLHPVYIKTRLCRMEVFKVWTSYCSNSNADRENVISLTKRASELYRAQFQAEKTSAQIHNAVSNVKRSIIMRIKAAQNVANELESFFFAPVESSRVSIVTKPSLRINCIWAANTRQNSAV